MRRNKLYLYIFLFVVMVWGRGFVRFVDLVSKHSPSDQKIDTEAIIVLTGGQKRIEAGIILLRENPSKRLFITGIDSRIKKILDVIKISTVLPKKTQRKVEFGQKATTTFENALEAKEWLELNKINSITLVTSAYHMPRSLLAFRDELPNIQIECYPILLKGFEANEWWKSPTRIIFLLKEYTKYSVVTTMVYIKKVYEKFI
jgi:uncharacterized SAM-binding protein YcdF (DUF218 family)